MVIKLVLLSFFLVGCGGREVKFNNNNLESKSQITQAEIQGYLKNGTLNKNSSNATVTYNGKNFTVSIYSSKYASDFIAALPMGSQVPVRFTGGTSGQQIVLETIQRQ